MAAAALALILGMMPAHTEVTDTELAAALLKFEKIARSAMEKSGVPGMAISIVHNDKAVWVKGFGVRKAGESAAVDGNTVFQLASVSKPIASTILAKLVSEDRISWDDPVTKHDPGFRLSDVYVTQRVTFRDLLSHRSGLPEHAGDLLEDLGYDRTEILSRLHNFNLGNDFRADYAYTNYGVTEAGVAGAAALGLDWETLAAVKLYLPLGMKNTSSWFQDYANSPNKAVGHVPADGNWFMNGKWAALFVRNPQAQSPGGGVSSTVNDLAQWMRLQLAGGKFEGRQFIKTVALDETHKPHMLSDYDPATGKGSFYGLCWGTSQDNAGRIFWKHSGEFVLGARSVVSLCPSENLGIAILVNAAPNGIPEGLEHDFYDLVFQGQLVPPGGYTDWVDFANDQFTLLTKKELSQDPTNYHQKPSGYKPPLDLGVYAGVYHNKLYGTLVVTQEKGKLVMKLGPKGVTFPLSHYTANTFYFVTQGEMRSGDSGAVFQVADGVASKVTLHCYNNEGLGEFTR